MEKTDKSKKAVPVKVKAGDGKTYKDFLEDVQKKNPELPFRRKKTFLQTALFEKVRGEFSMNLFLR